VGSKCCDRCSVESPVIALTSPNLGDCLKCNLGLDASCYRAIVALEPKRDRDWKSLNLEPIKRGLYLDCQSKPRRFAAAYALIRIVEHGLRRL
jgi:hypothetical protein